ncbi:hypothetical protein K788_0007922 (plasmid) [Paraburkholderia caribensis MBA4]|uniref:Uncharacterized protein n=1 Tax=Paraburkholderia caribensis MBA4 TaxID=1323664 RepID=A0A0P0RL94_9BURK|nr:hypothetical protein K788_0007922 [Paraburkholderia caribensis MBA4]
MLRPQKKTFPPEHLCGITHREPVFMQITSLNADDNDRLSGNSGFYRAPLLIVK